MDKMNGCCLGVLISLVFIMINLFFVGVGLRKFDGGVYNGVRILLCMFLYVVELFFGVVVFFFGIILCR